jgi:hypothetical protein
MLVFIMYLTQSTFHAIFAETENIVYKENHQDSKSSRLEVNNTFALSGFLVSTLNASLISNIGSGQDNHLISSSSDNTSLEHSVQTLSPGQPIGGVNSSGNSSSILNSNQGSRGDTTGTGQLNQTDNLSNNLVSMLSGIIIQSIEKGNPTINNDVNTSDSGSLIDKNISTIVSGNWKMIVNSSKVEFFDSKFVMITSDAKGFHWHTITNFKGDENVFFGTDDTIFFDGTVDFFTDNKLVSENSKVVIMLNNFEVLQIIFLDNKVADHFHDFPLYGILDSIEIKN